MNNAHVGEMVLDTTQIKNGVTQVAQRLNKKFEGQCAVVITVVPGGILFTADLVRELTFDIRMDYISCPHTPGDRNNDSEIVFHQNIELNGRNVILVDDAIESGGTMKRIAHYLNDQFELNSLLIATLFVKPGRVNIPVEQYYAYEMQNDDLLVGYGLPWKDRLRNLPYVSKLVK
ncbi:phosphoribosyltransferase [Vibrio sp. VB16]|uniref:phosphoribosyltransferase n=1 Tax=Vibrio sp. VB16 TaxID=2785746 RepID=UPI00189CD132|nr:phosphoribosyltransferase family protein [Vibrio sp. VB16]UGA53533.1 hypoxanthine phosphoribosyltransferase [Vibrio sp. VB16]